MGLGHSHHRHDHGHAPAGHADPASPRWHTVLWIALLVNAAMFVVELAAGLSSGSLALLADAVDFAGDAFNYGLSLVVLSMAAVWRSRAALFKGITMVLYGLLVLGRAVWVLSTDAVPQPLTMGLVGALALVANLGVALLLYRFRQGDANMRSVWLCTRNDALGNLAVLAAAAGVAGTASAWPDLAVAGFMATLAVVAGWAVVRQARAELAGT